MSTTRRLLVAGLLCASLVTAAPAAADPLPYPDFVAARGAAVAASGVFTPGTTMDIDVVTGSGGALRVTSNPDGSLTWYEEGDQGLYRMKCVRVDRCWEQSDIDFDDTLWHRLPPDSVVYRQASAGWDRLTDLDWPASATFASGTALDGSPTFTAIMTDEGLTLTEVITVRPRELTEVLTLTTDGEDLMVREVRMAAQDQPITVRPPARRTVGAPAKWLSAWTADINR